jgi:hypothetical protein
MGLEGNLQDLTTEPLYALQNSVSMAGMGLAMEGQEGNEVCLLRSSINLDPVYATLGSGLVQGID